MFSECVDWPAEFAERYVHEGYWRGETLGDMLRNAAAQHAERTALVDGTVRWSYVELVQRADALAAGMRGLGVKRGDRVVVQLPNIPDFLAVAYALFHIGAAPVFALPAHRKSEIVYLCECTEAVLYVLPDDSHGFDFERLANEVRERVPTLRELLVAGRSRRFTTLDDLAAATADAARGEAGPASRDVAFFLLSGGTTGAPKLIPRTHDDYAYQLRACVQALRMDDLSVYLAALSLAHNPALGCPGALGTLAVGGKVVLAQSAAPEETFPLVRREGVTHTTLMPVLVRVWMEALAWHKLDGSTLVLQVGGAKLDANLAREVRSRLGCTLTHWFGMAEGLLTYTRLDDADEVVATTQGFPLSPADEVRIVDALDREVPRGQIGELLARGPYTLRGYYKAREHNAAAFSADGFFRTGDLVRLTAEGRLVVEGRVKDLINRGGEKVSAEELEGHLLLHTSVRDVSVVAMPDALMGEKTCAFIVPANGQRPHLAALRTFLQELGVAEFKFPDRIEVVESLPLTRLGKVNKAELRKGIAAKVANVC